MKGATRPGLIAVTCCLILTPLWIVTMFHRGLWTPDEPREADIAWHMSLQSQRAVPTFAGKPFAEKPPLAYWTAGASHAAFPTNDAAFRLPNFVFAWLTTSAVVLLAAAATSSAGAWVAGLTFGTFLLGLQVTSWMASDAALMVGAAGALLGAFRGSRAASPLGRLGWFTLLHLSLAWAFLAKGPGALLVPVSAVVVLVLVERKRFVLRSPTFWLPALPAVSLALLWIIAVTRTPAGIDSLRVLLWSNVAGRFMHLSSAEAGLYSAGHRNYPGKYFVELPFYLAPWIFLFIAAARRAWMRVRQPDGGTWRFALITIAAAALALSFASTARGIYFAPALPACALLIALWYDESIFTALRLDRMMIAATLWLVAAMAILLLGAATLVTVSEAGAAFRGPLLAVSALLCFACLYLARNHLQGRRPRPFMTWLFLAYAVTLTTSSIVLFPAIDRWQDLASVARAVDRDAGSRTLVLYQPDETTIAMLDRVRAADRRSVSTTSLAEADNVLGGPDVAALLVLVPGHADGPLLQRLRAAGLHIPKPRGASAELVELCQRLSLSAEYVYEVPMGRRYALLSRRAMKTT